jgi:hypothetical protein
VQKVGDGDGWGDFRSLLVSTDSLHALVIKNETGGDDEKALCSGCFSAVVRFYSGG